MNGCKNEHFAFNEDDTCRPDPLFQINGADPVLAEVFPKAIHLHSLQRSAVMAALRSVDMHPSQSFCCVLIERKPGLSQRELADRFHIKPATVTNMLQRMEKSGLIRREPDPKDQRVQRLFVTENGIEANRHSEIVLNDLLKETYGRRQYGRTARNCRIVEKLLNLTERNKREIPIEDQNK
jgi:DNA-binding MarR family transcriptional regulator